MAELFRTRDDLIDEALTNLFADGGAGQAPDAESQATVDRKVDGLLAELRAREICDVVNDQQIPTAWFNPLAELLANECATAFGAQKSAALREDAVPVGVSCSPLNGTAIGSGDSLMETL